MPETPPLFDAEPDLVDRIFDYIAQELPEVSGSVCHLKLKVRQEVRGEECYIAGRPATARQQQGAQVRAMFNGRNATEVARRLGICRVTVWRMLKQSGDIKTVSGCRDMKQARR